MTEADDDANFLDPMLWEQAAPPDDAPTVKAPRTGTPTGARRGRKPGSRSTAKLKELQGELSTSVATFGTLTGGVVPVTGYVIVNNADPFSEAVVQLAKNNPRILAALERAAQVTPGITAARFVVTVLIALQVDFGRIAPTAVVPQALGVTEAWRNATQEGREAAANVTDITPPSQRASRVNVF